MCVHRPPIMFITDTGYLNNNASPHSMSISFQLRPRRSASRLYLDRSSSFCVLSMSTSASCDTANLQLTLTLTTGSNADTNPEVGVLGRVLGHGEGLRLLLREVCAELVLHHLHLDHLAPAQDGLSGEVLATHTRCWLVLVLLTWKESEPAGMISGLL